VCLCLLDALEGPLTRPSWRLFLDGVTTALGLMVGAVSLGLALDMVEGAPTLSETLRHWWARLPLFVWVVLPEAATVSVAWVSRRWARRGAWVALASTGWRVWPLALFVALGFLGVGGGLWVFPEPIVSSPPTGFPQVVQMGSTTELWVAGEGRDPLYGARREGADVVAFWVGEEAMLWDGERVRPIPVPDRPVNPAPARSLSLRFLWSWVASAGAFGGVLFGRRSFRSVSLWCLGVAMVQGFSLVWTLGS